MRGWRILALSIFLGLLFGIRFSTPLSVPALISCAVLLVLPGTLLGFRLFRLDQLSSRIFLALGLGYLLALLILYICSQTFASTSTFAVAFYACIGSFAATLIPLPKLPQSTEPELSRLGGRILISLLLLACLMRVYQVGTPEFQGDEARALILAEAVYQGQSDILFVHKKGPAEALLPYGMLSLSGQLTGFSARLPFAFAGVLIILGIFCLASTLWENRRGETVGLIAASIIIFDGFIFAFSRIVQYQSLLVLMCSCAVLCAIRARRSPSSYLYLYFSALFAAAGLLSHYDTLLLLPLLGFICWPCIKLSPRHAFAASCLFAFVCATFFVPFLLHDAIGTTASYLSQRMGPSQLPTNNLPRYIGLLSFYTTTFETMLLVIVPLLALCYLCWRQNKLLAACWLALLLSCLIFPGILALEGKRSLAGIGVLALIVVSSLKLKLQFQQQVLVFWIAPGLYALAFLFARPNTHFYVVHSGLALAAGLALHNLYQRRSQIEQRALLFGLIAVVCLNFYYTYIVYLRQLPEYRQVFPRARPLIYWAGYGDTLPSGVFFGFPRRSGWDVVQTLFQSGELSGSYDSNEEALITAWYTRGAIRKTEWPDYYFIAANPNDPVPVPRTSLEKTYFFWGRIYVDNQRRLDIYSRLYPERAPKRFDYEKLNFYSSLASPLNLNNALLALNQSR